MHIVFQVLNYLADKRSRHHKLLPIDQVILIRLASYINENEDCWYSLQKIAEACNISRRYLITRMEYLESIELVAVRTTSGKTNHYRLNLFSHDLSTTSDLQITSDENDTSDLQITYQCSVDHPTSDLQITRIQQEEINNKKTTNKRCDDFIHDDELSFVPEVDDFIEQLKGGKLESPDTG